MAELLRTIPKANEEVNEEIRKIESEINVQGWKEKIEAIKVKNEDLYKIYEIYDIMDQIEDMIQQEMQEEQEDAKTEIIKTIRRYFSQLSRDYSIKFDPDEFIKAEENGYKRKELKELSREFKEEEKVLKRILQIDLKEQDESEENEANEGTDSFLIGIQTDKGWIKKILEFLNEIYKNVDRNHNIATGRRKKESRGKKSKSNRPN